MLDHSDPSVSTETAIEEHMSLSFRKGGSHYIYTVPGQNYFM